MLDVEEGSGETKYNGLINEGNTCYINSLLQTMYMLGDLRRAIYMIPTKKEKDYKSIPLCLQRIFFNLQEGQTAVRTHELLAAFGWGVEQRNIQQDASEF